MKTCSSGFCNSRGISWLSGWHYYCHGQDGSYKHAQGYHVPYRQACLIGRQKDHKS